MIKKVLWGCVLWSLVLRMGVLIWRNADYWYDEMIVTNISKQDINQLLDSVSSEPHPVGFYFFLKLFPVDDPLKTRIMLLVLSQAILIIGLIWLLKMVGMWKNLVVGISIFLVTYGYLWSGMDVKQGIVIVPLWMWWFWVWIKAYNQYLIRSEWVLWVLLTIVISAFDYRYFGVIVVLSLVLALFKKNVMWLANTFVAVATSLLSLYVVGWSQVISNATRFEWTASRVSSLFLGTSSFFMGAPFNEWMGDVLMLGVCVLLGISFVNLYYRWKKDKASEWIGLGMAGGAILSIMIIARAFVMVRYALPFYLILCLFLGYSLQMLIKHEMGKKLFIFAMGIFLVSGLFGLVTYNPGWISKDFLRAIDSKGQKFGFLADHPNFALVTLITHPEIRNVVGINLYDLEASMKAMEVNRSVLSLEGIDLRRGEMTEFEMGNSLLRSEIENFFFLETLDPRNIFDKERMSYQLLGKNCTLHKIQSLGAGTFLYTWVDCNFDKYKLANPVPVEKV